MSNTVSCDPSSAGQHTWLGVVTTSEGPDKVATECRQVFRRQSISLISRRYQTYHQSHLDEIGQRYGNNGTRERMPISSRSTQADDADIAFVTLLLLFKECCIL